MRSSSYNGATVHFTLDNHTLGDRIRTYLSADKISIQPYGLVTSNLKIKPLDRTPPGPYTLPINASIDTVTVATTRKSEKTILNMENQSKNQSSYFTITVLPELTYPEMLDNFVKQWILPMTGIWTLLAGIAAVMAPLILRAYRKKIRNPT